jgi:hypothetical protein
VTLKKLVKALVQVFSGRTTKPVWFLKLWPGGDGVGQIESKPG